VTLNCTPELTTLRFLCILLLFARGASADPQTVPRKPLLVGYVGQWGLYNVPPYTLKDLAADRKAAMLDQLNYAQAFVTGGRCSVADPNADLNHPFSAAESVDGQADDPASPFRGHLHQLAELKRAYPRLKVLISLEGHAPDFAFDAQPENRQAFVASCIHLLIQGNLAPGVRAPGLFDGIDLDWEYPRGGDAANFLALLAEFRTQMNLVRPGLLLSVAVGPSPRMYEGVDFSAVAALVDEIGVMTYDFAGPWMHTTGLIAPLYGVARPAPPGSLAAGVAASGSPSNPAPHGGTGGSVESFLTAGVPAAKLLMGVPFYGYGWTQVPEVDNGLYQEGTPVRGDRPYRSIASLLPTSTIYRDAASATPWLFDGDAFWTFDDPVSIRAKAAFAVEHRLAGLMIWELSGDTVEGTLLHAARAGLSSPDQQNQRSGASRF
jgi:chitinase